MLRDVEYWSFQTGRLWLYSEGPNQSSDREQEVSEKNTLLRFARFAFGYITFFLIKLGCHIKLKESYEIICSNILNLKEYTISTLIFVNILLF